jgi:hypothetical protein
MQIYTSGEGKEAEGEKKRDGAKAQSSQPKKYYKFFIDFPSLCSHAWGTCASLAL